MTLNIGPVDVANNVFNIDAANRKSWAGSGADRITAIYPSWGVWNGLTGSCIAYTAPSGTPAVYLTIVTGGGVNYWNSVAYSQPCSSSTQYIISAKIRYTGSSTTPSANLFYVRQYNSVGAQTSESGKYSTAQQIDLGNGWYYAWAYFTTDSTATSFLVQGYEYSGAMTIWIEDVQCKLAGTNDVAGGLSSTVGNISTRDNNAAFYFNGSTSAMTYGTANFNKTTGQPLTISCWLNPSRLGGQYQNIVCNRTDYQYNWMLYQHTNDGSIQVHGTAQNKSSYIPTVGTWVHITVAIDSSSNYLLYANGTVQQTVTGYAYSLSTPSLLCIGRYGSNSEYYQGYIGNVQLYDRALLATEVVQLFNSQRSRYGI